MNRFATALLVGAMTTLIAAPACSQQPPGRGLELMGVAGQKSVQEDLKLSAEKVKAIDEAREKQRGSMGNFRDMNEDDRRAKMAELHPRTISS